MSPSPVSLSFVDEWLSACALGLFFVLFRSPLSSTTPLAGMRGLIQSGTVVPSPQRDGAAGEAGATASPCPPCRRRALGDTPLLVRWPTSALVGWPSRQDPGVLSRLIVAPSLCVCVRAPWLRLVAFAPFCPWTAGERGAGLDLSVVWPLSLRESRLG